MREEILDLAADFASGGAQPEGILSLEKMLASASAEERLEVSQIVDAGGLLGQALPKRAPRPELKDRILAKVTGESKPKAPAPDLHFIRGGSMEGWIKLPVPGAEVKILSTDPKRGIAVALGKLAAGSKYPAHTHKGAEEVYVISGDLKIGETVLAAGDFHHAGANSRHDINYSENGCMVLVVMTIEDLQDQFASFEGTPA